MGYPNYKMALFFVCVELKQCFLVPFALVFSPRHYF
jgi:NADH:ubiquinone oxidoreductase subunit 3 (subunit A)